MPAIHPRPSSTKGKHIHLSSPALAKGSACTTCKTRKVRCNGLKPSCNSCRRTARFEGRNEEEVVCCYEGKKCGTRKSRRASAEQEEEQKSTLEQLPPLPLLLPSVQQPETNLDTKIDCSNLAAKLLALNHLSTVDSNLSNFSAMSSDRPSSSTASSFDLPASSSTSSISYTPLDSTLLPIYFPSQAYSASPPPMLDSADYFSALHSGPSASASNSNSFDISSSAPYRAYDLSSLFLASPAPCPTPSKAEPSYFGMAPPIAQQEWPATLPSETGLGSAMNGGGGVGSMPLTPGWFVDHTALGFY